MRGIERKNAIMEQIRINGKADVNELAKRYKVSTMTIRRDLSKLAAQDLITTEYGGAVLKKGSLFEHAISIKQTMFQDEKQRIAAYCLNYIQDGDTIFLDAGTTTAEIAKLLVDSSLKLTIVTHSFLIANILVTNENIELIFCPGKLRFKSMAVLGTFTEEFISSFSYDKLFLSVEGLDIENGFSVPNIEDGNAKKLMIQNSSWIACVTDSSKFNSSYFYKFSKLENANVIITDKNIDKNILNDYKQCIEVITV